MSTLSASRHDHHHTHHSRSRTHHHDQDTEATQEYLRLIESIHHEWDALEAQADTSVMPSDRVMKSVMEAVRADARHGAQVQAPPTDLGPYTLSELSLRTLVRTAVDSVPGVRALRSSCDHAPATEGHRGPGLPVTIHCRISARAAPGDLPDLGALAQQVREAVRRACHDHLEVSPDVDVHVEDLHDDQ